MKNKDLILALQNLDPELEVAFLDYSSGETLVAWITVENIGLQYKRNFIVLNGDSGPEYAPETEEEKATKEAISKANRDAEAKRLKNAFRNWAKNERLVDD